MRTLREIKRHKQESQKHPRVIISGNIPRKEPKLVPVQRPSSALSIFIFLMTHTHHWSTCCLYSLRQTGNKHAVLPELHHGAGSALARVIRTFTSLNPVGTSRLISPGLAITAASLTGFPYVAPGYHTLSVFHLP